MDSSLRVERRSTGARRTDYIPATIYDIPQDIMLYIFNQLDAKSCESSIHTCRSWKAIFDHRGSNYSQYFRPIRQLTWDKGGMSDTKKLLSTHGIPYKDISKTLPQFLSRSKNHISIQPPFPGMKSVTFLKNYAFLSRFGDTLFLIEREDVKSLGELGRFSNHKLITKNKEDPSKDRSISFLVNPCNTKDDLSRCQIRDCFPISESNIALVTGGKKVPLFLLFCDLSSEKPTCTQPLELKDGSWQVYRIGDYLVLNKQIIHLATQSPSDHGFDFSRFNVKTSNSGLCFSNNEKGATYLALSSSGKLEKQWTSSSLLALDINEKYIVALDKDEQTSLLILNLKGEVLHTIKLNYREGYSGGQKYMDWPFARLSGDILTYSSRKGSICFFHIPTQSLIQECEWKALAQDSILDIKDMRYNNGKFTVSLSTQIITGTGLESWFRVMELDSQYTPPEGLGKKISKKVKGIFK